MSLLTTLLITGGVAATAKGLKSGTLGGKEIFKSNKKLQRINKRHEKNIKEFDQLNLITTYLLDKIGNNELIILQQFESFSELFEKIQNRPEFDEIISENIQLPSYDINDLKMSAAGASAVIGAVGGAGSGVSVGIAAAGATQGVVATVATASTGTAISSLSGAAAQNATLAAIGGGAKAVGGGGMALGIKVLGASSLGIGSLVAGEAIRFTGEKVGNKVDDSELEMHVLAKKMRHIGEKLNELYDLANKYFDSLKQVNELYQNYFHKMNQLVNVQEQTDWTHFTMEEKRDTQNLVLLTGVLYEMCQVNLVAISEDKEEMNQANKEEIEEIIGKTAKILKRI